MPDAARIAQAQALEVPLILQGAKTVDETGHRELFKENATTTLVFDNGAVLNLHSKLAVGQTVFIHNQQNGREILCKVVEAPPENEPGFTDLEFTTSDPLFWDPTALRTGTPAQNLESAAEQPAATEQPAAPADDMLAMMSSSTSKINPTNMMAPGQGVPLREELMPAHEMAPDPSAAPVVPVPDFEPAVTTNSNPTEPTGEQIDAALKQMSVAAATPDTSAEPENEKDQKHLSALMEREARLAKFAAFKEKQAEKIQRDAAARDAGKGGAKDAVEGASEIEDASDSKPVWTKVTLLDKLTTGKNATYVTIGVAALIAVALFFVWQAVRGIFIHPADVPVASAPAQPTAAPAPAANPATPDASPAPAATASANAPQPIVVPAQKATAALRVPAEVRRAPNRSDAAADSDAARLRDRKQDAAGASPMAPAMVLSQPQPTLPHWAKDMELDGVVTMDVTINEKGNVADTKVLSGPRALQHEAERALSLWQFQPARLGGKPTSSHITLSVEFLPPRPPKRPWE